MNAIWYGNFCRWIAVSLILGAIASAALGQAEPSRQVEQGSPAGPVPPAVEPQPGGPLVPPPIPQPPGPPTPKPQGEIPGQDLPLNIVALSTLQEVPASPLRNLISLGDIRQAIGDGPTGLTVRLGKLTRLLDGTLVDPKMIYGTACFGPYPFEAAEARFAYKRFRLATPITDGAATLEVGRLLVPGMNSEAWKDHGTVGVRLELFLATAGKDGPLGIYDTPVTFRKMEDGYQRLPTIIEGPFVVGIASDDPTQAAIHFVTDSLTNATVLLDDGRQFPSVATDRHFVRLGNLLAQRDYRYEVRVGVASYGPYHLRTASYPGPGTATFAFCGDSREGFGGGTQDLMGVNYAIMERLAAIASQEKADFLLMGGDLVNGYTTSPGDYDTQLDAWKQAVAGFWRQRPVYTTMGNHDSFLRVYQDGSGRPIVLDRWPYATVSSEAVFARAFFNPANAPEPSDPRRPPYLGSVFSFQDGPLRIIAFNTSYWHSSRPEEVGGSPEGYILPDQMAWLESQLDQAEADRTVQYVVLFTHVPMFPCGGHTAGAMWYGGNNNVRAYTFAEGQIRPETAGILEVRNRLIEKIGASRKVAAVLASHEHAYCRLLIDRNVPVGVPQRDDRNQDGKIDWSAAEPASSLPTLKYPTWYLTSGGAGAPYYSEEPAPWNRYWHSRPQAQQIDSYRFSSQENILLFRADRSGVSLHVYNPYGELIDEIRDLMAVKR